MKNVNVKVELLLIIICIIPLAYLASNFRLLPDMVPTHFGFDGKPNDYSHKESLIYIILGMNVGINLLMFIIPFIDPKKNLSQGDNIYVKIRVLVQLLMAAISCFIIYSAVENSADTKIMFVMLGLFFSAMGYLLRDVKPNYFVGIRTPWTLQSEDNWQKTHKACGSIWLIGGILIALIALVIPEALQGYFMLCSIIPLVLIPVGYSYWLYTRENKTNKT